MQPRSRPNQWCAYSAENFSGHTDPEKKKAGSKKGENMSQVAGAFDFKKAVEDAIALWERYANAKDAAGVASLYTEDATLLPQGAPAFKGRQNIQQFFEGFFAAGASDPKVRPVEVVAMGDMAYEIGTWAANMPVPQGGTVPSEGKYVVIWKRQADGNVKLHVDIFNANS
jgi:uncharacterized protein (TIGR02246 family)